jgi:hypothetical protein
MRDVVIGAALTPTLSREERERGISTDLLHEISRRRLPEPPRRVPVIDSADGARRFLVRNAEPEAAACGSAVGAAAISFRV